MEPLDYLVRILGSDAIRALMNVLVIVALSLSIGRGLFRAFISPPPISYKVGVVGLPRSGKTTLITAAFAEIFRGRAGGQVRVTGEQSIQLVNKNLARLEAGLNIGPTKIADTFVYRFIFLARGLLFFRRRYEVELADFPGEYSKVLLDTQSSGEAPDPDGRFLYDKQYFSWLQSSRVICFVVDLGAFLTSRNRKVYASELTSRIRASWQALDDAWQERGHRASRPRVALVFTKADLLTISLPTKEIAADLAGNRQDTSEVADENFDLVRRYAFEEAPPNILFDANQLEGRAVEIRASFRDLERYFKVNNVEHSTFFTSAYADGGSGRYGMNDLLAYVLPRD